ncbi:MAG: SAM-dependent methyltransferase [Pirellulales bacterium]|nr:SAM-dependent methyltransferase [Pirellulales bacterium]
MIELTPIGYVRSSRVDPIDDAWDSVDARIELSPGVDAAALDGLEDYSHVEVIFFFDQVAESAIEHRARHPRGNTDWPRVGIFAQRAKNRPNRLGTTIVELKAREGRVLHVAGLDAIDGTPVLDLKPVMVEFLPRSPVRQPAWTHELMREYWSR